MPQQLAMQPSITKSFIVVVDGWDVLDEWDGDGKRESVGRTVEEGKRFALLFLDQDYRP